MDKRYQVFVSSTFEDLKEERKAVIECLLNAGYIPAGMELFSAANDDQFQYIKKIIDNCDYYVLIIAGRYGSINPSTHLSFTEQEYNYAKSKGLPILVFPYDKPFDLPESKRDDTNKKRLVKFRKTVSENRLYKSWHTVGGLCTDVINSLNNAVKEQQPEGWIRGHDLLLMEQQARELRTNNANLLQRISQLEKQIMTLDESNKSLFGVRLNHLNLCGAPLKGAKLTMASLKASQLDGADLTGAVLDDANLSYCSLKGAILQRISANNTLFAAADLCGADLRDANLSNANFIDTNLERADLRGATLHTSVFMRVNLAGAILDSRQLNHRLLKKSYNPEQAMIYIAEEERLLSFEEYQNKNYRFLQM